MLKAFAKSIRQAQSIHKLMAYNTLDWSIFREQANSAELRSSLSKLERFKQLFVLSCRPSHARILFRTLVQINQMNSIHLSISMTAPHQSEAPFVGERVFQNRGVCLQAFPRCPTPSALLSLICSRPNFRTTRIIARTRHIALRSYGNNCYAGYQ